MGVHCEPYCSGVSVLVRQANGRSWISERFLTTLRKEVDKISDKDMKEKVSTAVENDIGLYKDELNKNITYIDITER